MLTFPLCLSLLKFNLTYNSDKYLYLCIYLKTCILLGNAEYSEKR